MSKVKWPSVSFIIATCNSERTIETCLSSIRKQSYPAPIEIVIGDGESTDKTLDTVSRYKAKVFSIPKDKQNAEYNKGIAANSANNEVLVFIDHDNILPHKNWLINMVKPLIENENIFGTGVLQFHYKKSMTLLDRYFALFGAVDPVAYYLNKSAHQSWIYNRFNLRGELVEETEKYFLVELNPERMPALGGNGAVLRKELLKKAKSNPDNFFHIDVHVDLVRQGFCKYAFVKETIIHLTNNNFIPFLKRRKYYIEKYHFTDHSKRRYSIYESEKDKVAIIGYIIYSLTIVGPFTDSIQGYLKIRDLAWFVHPFICLMTLVIYGQATVKQKIKNVFLAK